jgi:hypothetical protein
LGKALVDQTHVWTLLLWQQRPSCGTSWTSSVENMQEGRHWSSKKMFLYLHLAFIMFFV